MKVLQCYITVITICEYSDLTLTRRLPHLVEIEGDVPWVQKDLQVAPGQTFNAMVVVPSYSPHG